MAHTQGRLARNIPPITRYPTLYAGRNKHVCVVVTQGVNPEEAEANAERIIKCWNAHDVLMKALEDIERDLASHPDANTGNTKVHYALMRARGALNVGSD
jgi:hypothetical protein